MTAATKVKPTIRFSRSRGKTSFRCSCGASCTLRDEALVRSAAQLHADWHWDRSEHPTIELGGLL